MKTDSPDIELNEADKDLLRRAESNSGKPWRTLLREVLAPVLGVARSQDDVAAQQKRRFLESSSRIDAMPVESESEGFSNRDHDKILYGGE